MSNKFDKLFANLAKVLEDFQSGKYKDRMRNSVEACAPSSRGLKTVRKTIVKISFNRAKTNIKKKKSKE